MVNVQATDGYETTGASPFIRLSSSNLGTFLEISPAALVFINQDGIIVAVNQQAEALFGYPHAQLLNQPLEQLLPERFRDSHREHLVRYFSAPSPRPMGEGLSLFGLRRDGTEFPLDIGLKTFLLDEKFVAMADVHDMSAQRHLEEELAKRSDEREQIMHKLEAMNQQLYGLFEHAPAGLVLFDARPPYQVLLHNTVFQQFFPEPFYSEGMLGKYLPDYVVTAEEEGVSELFREVVSTRQSKTLFNFVYDGMPRGRTWWNWHLAPIIKDGEVTALTQMVIETTQEVLARQQLETELTERRRAEDALRQSHNELVVVNANLEQANLARSQFLATMSHELRTPLAAIIGFSEMLLEDAREAEFDQEQQRSLESILNNGRFLLGLINDVLDLSKMEMSRMVLDSSQVDLRDLLGNVAAETQSLAIKRNLSLRTEMEEGLDCLETNQMKVHQILLNLVSNALKFTEHGEVALSASRAVLSGTGAEGIAFAVQDSGIGIPADLQERIFEAFYQADMSYTRRVGGTGLGLAIVRQLTALLGGTISVESAPEQGSTFTVTLPVNPVHRFTEQGLPRLYPMLPELALTRAPAARELVTAPSPDRLEGPGQTEGQGGVILVVDDDLDTIVVIKRAMLETPYTIIGMHDPCQVMELVQEMRPCAITLDVMMPNLNGWQLLHQLKENPATASIPVVMLTVLSEQSTGYVLGADDYLIKPFKREVLRTTLQRVIEASRREAQSVAGKD